MRPLVIAALVAAGCGPQAGPSVAAAPATPLAAPLNPSAAHEAVVVGRFHGEPECVALREALTCATIAVDFELNIMTGPTYCDAWCTRADGVADGEYRGRDIGITRPRALIVGSYVAGVPRGRWRAWHDAERQHPIIDEGYDDEGRLHGARTVHHAKGTLLLAESFEHGVRAGDYEVRYADGRPHVKGRFATGEPPEWELWSTSSTHPLAGRIEGAARAAIAGVPVGAWSIWHPGGALAATYHYDDQGRPDGSFCEHAPGGALLGCQDLRHGNGTVLIHEDSGELQESWKFRGGLLNGEHLRYADGRLALREHYQRGKLHGTRETWDEESRLIRRETFVMGELDGPFFEQWFHDDVREITRGRHCRGEKCGHWLRTMPPSRFRELEVYDARGRLILRRSVDDQGNRLE